MGNVIDISSAKTNVDVVKHPTRFGVTLKMGPGSASRISPTWTMAGWRLQFVRLISGDSLLLDQSAGAVFVKVIEGALASPHRRTYPAVGDVVTTRLAQPVISAGSEGALLSVYTRTPAAPPAVQQMNQLVVNGPMAEAFAWQSFEQRYNAYTPFFNGTDAHLVPGFHLLDNDGAEIAYVFFWTAGKGVDLSTHNHGNTPNPDAPAFAEVHQVLYNGTGTGGMYSTPEPGAAERHRLPMFVGEEHGPFFVITGNGTAKLRENGAVEYPWHGWQAGQDGLPGQAYDLVCAYEITAPYAKVV